ncbi:MAG: hypothetical protein K2Q06_02020, partial [Parvularculaceae bacterium]|nr:hypothetical protein [Parvularculaceae bacterium]
MRWFIILASVAGLLMGAAILGQGPGSQLGLWNWRDGLGMVRTLAFPSFAVTAATLIAFLLSLRAGRGLAAFAAIGLIVSAAASSPRAGRKERGEGEEEEEGSLPPPPAAASKSAAPGALTAASVPPATNALRPRLEPVSSPSSFSWS